MLPAGGKAQGRKELVWEVFRGARDFHTNPIGQNSVT